MKKIIALCLLCTTFNLNAATFEHAKQIYMKVLIANQIRVAPGLRYNPTGEVNAKCGFWSITINAGMLRYVRNDAELALVLGHELGHYVLRHYRSTPSNEFAADAQGAYFMSKAGYNVCIGARGIKRFNDRADSTHPDSNERFYRLCH